MLESLQWAARETERRLIAANRAHQAGDPPPEDTKRPLWILLDRPSAFTHLAAADGREDPQSLLQIPLRHGRPANVTVVVADQLDSLETLSDAVRQHTRARVLLGPATPEQVTAVLGAPPHTTPLDHVPAGRGYARLGTGPVHRLQVPATPNPYDDTTGADHRKAVLDLLPARSAQGDARTEPTRTEPERTAPESGPVRRTPADATCTDKHSLEKKPVDPATTDRAVTEPYAADTTDTTDTDKAPLEPVPAEAAAAEPS
ncbi:hypothetical protein SHIRM173S_05446 [Streptomyces hirsutus]